MADTDPALLRPSLFRTLFFVAITAASLVLIDSVLARTERRETALVAAGFDRDGQWLMQQGQYPAAADAFRSAIANARDNADYQLALGQALLKAGQLDEAAATLTALLEANSMAGAPNLAMARVFLKKGQFEDAASYYHRAIYGQWGENATDNRITTRFELADLLASRNSKAELLAELLPLEDEASGMANQEKLARLFLTAGSPARAAAIFHDLARAHPRDADPHEGVGDAEFALADYAAAQAGYVAALRLRADAPELRRKLELCDQVLNLDPMRRGLSGQERYERSIHVLQVVADKAALCSAQGRAGNSADLADAANAALKMRVPAGRQGDAAEANLELANKLWQGERANCAAAVSAADEPLQLVLAKAAQ